MKRARIAIAGVAIAAATITAIPGTATAVTVQSAPATQSAATSVAPAWRAGQCVTWSSVDERLYRAVCPTAATGPTEDVIEVVVGEVYVPTRWREARINRYLNRRYGTSGWDWFYYPDFAARQMLLTVTRSV